MHSPETIHKIHILAFCWLRLLNLERRKRLYFLSAQEEEKTQDQTNRGRSFFPFVCDIQFHPHSADRWRPNLPVEWSFRAIDRSSKPSPDHSSDRFVFVWLGGLEFLPWTRIYEITSTNYRKKKGIVFPRQNRNGFWIFIRWDRKRFGLPQEGTPRGSRFCSRSSCDNHRAFLFVVWDFFGILSSRLLIDVYRQPLTIDKPLSVRWSKDEGDRSNILVSKFESDRFFAGGH